MMTNDQVPVRMWIKRIPHEIETHVGEKCVCQKEWVHDVSEKDFGDTEDGKGCQKRE